MRISTSGGNPSAPAFSADTLAAYIDVQQRLSRTSSSYLMERYERSLDEFLRNPARTGAPSSLVNNAYGNAGKVVRSHRRHLTSPAFEQVDERATAEYAAADLRVFVDQTLPPSRDRDVSHLLLAGADAEQISKAINISESSAYVVVSRLRRQHRQVLAIGGTT